MDSFPLKGLLKHHSIAIRSLSASAAGTALCFFAMAGCGQNGTEPVAPSAAHAYPPRPKMAAPAEGPPIKGLACIKAPMTQLESVLGPVNPPVNPKPFFYQFSTKGFQKVVIDKPGPQMTTLSFYFNSALPWQAALQKLKVSSTGVSTANTTNPEGNQAMTRNLMELNGIKGLPAGWKASTEDYALANQAKLREMKPQIVASTGAARLKLIRDCDDWFTVVHFMSP